VKIEHNIVFVNFEERLGSDGRSACHVAVERGNFALVKFLLEEGLMQPSQQVICSAPRNRRQDTRTQLNDTCFHIAARDNNWDIFSELMNYHSKDVFAKLMTELRNDLEQDPLYPLLETFFSLQSNFKGFSKRKRGTLIFNITFSLVPGVTFPFPKKMHLESFAKRVDSHGKVIYALKETLPCSSVVLCPALLEEKTLMIVFILCQSLKTDPHVTTE